MSRKDYDHRSDSSSDFYGAHLAEALKSMIPEAALFGVGGSMMEGREVQLLYNVSDLENLGGLEVLKTSHVIKRLVQRISEAMDEYRPELVVQIGLPAFSLKLVELAKAKELPVVYYNSPLNWGTEPVKLSRLAKAVDKIAVSVMKAGCVKATGSMWNLPGTPWLI